MSHHLSRRDGRTAMHNKNVILRIVIVALLCYTLSNFIAARERLHETEMAAQLLRLELTERKQENEQLKAQLESIDDEDELRALAWQRLGMVMPDEKVFYFTTDREDTLWGWK